jgi:hypothetical protein
LLLQNLHFRHPWRSLPKRRCERGQPEGAKPWMASSRARHRDMPCAGLRRAARCEGSREATTRPGRVPLVTFLARSRKVTRLRDGPRSLDLDATEGRTFAPSSQPSSPENCSCVSGTSALLAVAHRGEGEKRCRRRRPLLDWIPVSTGMTKDMDSSFGFSIRRRSRQLLLHCSTFAHPWARTAYIHVGVRWNDVEAA